MYAPGCEHKGPTGAAMVLACGRVLQRCYVSPFSEERVKTVGTRKPPTLRKSRHASRGRSYRHASSREYHVPTGWTAEEVLREGAYDIA